MWGVFGIAAVALAIGQQLVERGAVGFAIQRPTVLAGRDLSTAVTVQVFVGAAMAILLLVAAPRAAVWYGNDDLQHLLIAGAVALLAYSLRAIPLGLLERSMSYGRVAAIETLDLFAFNAIAVLGVAAGFGLWALSAAILTRSLASLIAAFALARVPRISLGVSAQTLREMIGFAAPYTVANALTSANTAAAPILVGTFVGTREFGVLQMSYTVLVYPQVLTAIIGRVALPQYAREAQTDLLVARVNSGTTALMRYVGGATLLLAVTSLIWVPSLFGSDWIRMSAYMLVMAPVYALERSFALVITALTASGKVLAILLVGLAFTLIYWASGAIMIPRLGALGLPTAYAVASLSFIGYIVVYRYGVGHLNIRGGLLEFIAFALLVAVATGWYVNGGPMIAVAAVSVAIAVLILRDIPSLRRPSEMNR
jgi:PST family polysaccharide transporter